MEPRVYVHGGLSVGEHLLLHPAKFASFPQRGVWRHAGWVLGVSDVWLLVWPQLPAVRLEPRPAARTVPPCLTPVLRVVDRLCPCNMMCFERNVCVHQWQVVTSKYMACLHICNASRPCNNQGVSLDNVCHT